MWFDFLFTLPYNRFTISRSADLTTFALLLAVGVAVSQMAAWARRLKAVTVADAGLLHPDRESAELTQQAGTPYDVVEHVRRQLIEVLGLRDCRFEYGKLLGQPPRLEPDGSVRTRYGYYPVDSSGPCRRKTSSSAPSATASTPAASCSRRSPAPGHRSAPALSPWRWPAPATRSATARRTRREAAPRVTGLPFWQTLLGD